MIRFALLVSLLTCNVDANIIRTPSSGLLHTIINSIQSAKVKEEIIHQMDECKKVKEAGVFDIIIEVVKYKDFTTGKKVRYELSEACYERLRQKVTSALDRKYIEPLQDPPCRSGWGSFRIYEQGRFRLTDTNRYLPCVKT